MLLLLILIVYQLAAIVACLVLGPEEALKMNNQFSLMRGILIAGSITVCLQWMIFSSHLRALKTHNQNGENELDEYHCSTLCIEYNNCTCSCPVCGDHDLARYCCCCCCCSFCCCCCCRCCNNTACMHSNSCLCDIRLSVLIISLILLYCNCWILTQIEKSSFGIVNVWILIGLMSLYFGFFILCLYLIVLQWNLFVQLEYPKHDHDHDLTIGGVKSQLFISKSINSDPNININDVALKEVKMFSLENLN